MMELEEREQFVIENDKAANWAVRQIREAREKMQSLREQADDAIQEYEAKIEQEEERYKGNCKEYEDTIARMTAHLHAYFGQVEPKKTKTQATYKLQDGRLVEKLPKLEYVPQRDGLLEYLKQAGMTEYVKVTEEPKWGELKKQLVTDGAVVCIGDTGEVLDCVSIVEKPGSFEVEV